MVFPTTEGLHPALEGQKAEPVRAARRLLQPPGRGGAGLRTPTVAAVQTERKGGGGKTRGKHSRADVTWDGRDGRQTLPIG